MRLFQNSSIYYKERAAGEFEIKSKNPILKKLFEDIKKSIKNTANAKRKTTKSTIFIWSISIL